MEKDKYYDELKELGLDDDLFDLLDISKNAEYTVELVNNDYIEGKKMAYLPLLAGIATCKIESRPGAGHNYYEVVDAIHRCFAKNPTGGYDAGYKESIFDLIRVSSSKVASLELLLNIIFYQLKKEKNGTAEFTIDMNEYLPLINNMIKENRSTYEADYKMFGPWLERYKKSALEKYGLELG